MVLDYSRRRFPCQGQNQNICFSQSAFPIAFSFVPGTASYRLNSISLQNHNRTLRETMSHQRYSSQAVANGYSYKALPSENCWISTICGSILRFEREFLTIRF